MVRPTMAGSCVMGTAQVVRKKPRMMRRHSCPVATGGTSALVPYGYRVGLTEGEERTKQSKGHRGERVNVLQGASERVDGDAARHQQTAQY